MLSCDKTSVWMNGLYHGVATEATVIVSSLDVIYGIIIFILFD